MAYIVRILALLLIVLLPSCREQGSGSVALSERPPNIILIVADDLGFGEVGCYGQEIISTPAIDRIAENGMKFTRFYSGSPVCAPSRCTLMTGKHTGHAYIRDNGNPDEPDPGLPFPGQHPIPDSLVTVAELLKEQGYTTACIGKWGLGHTGTSGNPGNQGFDLFYGYKCQVHAHNHFPAFLWRNDAMEQLEGNDRTLEGKQHSQDLFAREALDFIRANRDTSFFLYLPFIIPHLSIQTTDTFLEMYRDSVPEAEYEHTAYLRNPAPRAAYAGMVSQMDHAISLILEEIANLGLEEETLIIFTSDNGPTYDRLGGSDSDFFQSSGPLSGRKGSLNEGGIRVPLVVQWKGKIEPGTVTDLQAAFWDILPTLCGVSGTLPPEGVDGISILPTLTGRGKQETHESLYWEFPSYGGQAALVSGEWKLLVQGLYSNDDPPSVQLYNLNEDIAEQRDLSADFPRRTESLLKEMERSHIQSELFEFRALEGLFTQRSPAQ